MANVPYTDEDNARIREMRAHGETITAIAKEFGRTPGAMTAKIQYLEAKDKGLSSGDALKASKKRGPKPRKVREFQPEVDLHHKHQLSPKRPMIALVGEPAEIVNTLRELFS